VPPPAADALEAALRTLARAGAVAVPFPSPAYPPRLATLADPPPLLLVRGEVAALAGPAVAIVGSRAASAYGIAAARSLAAGLAQAGIVVVSGLARGIDAAAHRAALEAGGRTVAVQACGPELVYPPEHRALAGRIAAQGALVSELPPGSPPLAQHFPLRNRLISGLSDALVVVEARERSGSLISARHALDQGIDVLAVPGPIDSPTSAGTNRLLRDGAAPALGPEDVLEALGRAAPQGERAAAESEPADPVLAALRHEPATRDELARRLALEPERLALALLEHELEGRVVEDRDGRLRARPRARRGGSGVSYAGRPHPRGGDGDAT
jgi:DNA processing protein